MSLHNPNDLCTECSAVLPNDAIGSKCDACHDRFLSARSYLVDSTGKRVAEGDTVTDFRGDKAIVTSIELPRHNGSTGRVYVRQLDDPTGQWTAGYYPSVFNLTWR